MKLYVWTVVFYDEAESVAMAVASNIDEAKLLVKSNIDDDELYAKFMGDGELEVFDIPCAHTVMN